MIYPVWQKELNVLITQQPAHYLRLTGVLLKGTNTGCLGLGGSLTKDTVIYPAGPLYKLLNLLLDYTTCKHLYHIKS